MKFLTKTKLQNKNNHNVLLRFIAIFTLILFFSDVIKGAGNTIDKIIEEEMINGNLVGLSISVVKDGRTIHQKSYGFTDLERKTPFTNSTQFRWASISKVIVAVAIHQLIEDKKLKLNDKVSDKVSYWATDGKKKDITIRHLLSHRSGINHYNAYNRNMYKGGKTDDFLPRQSVDVFKTSALNFNPDSQFEYSTFGYNLLGAVIHEVGGGFGKYINLRIRDKLGMPSLNYNSNNSIKGYDKLCNDVLENRDGSDIIWKVPGGGYISNIVDLNKFMLGLMNGTLLKSTDVLWSEDLNGDVNYSLGLKRFRRGTSDLFAEHGGAHRDVRTKMIFNTTKKDGIVIAINGGNYADFTLDRIIDRIANSTGIYNWSRSVKPYHYSRNKNVIPEGDSKVGSITYIPCGGDYVALWHKGDSNTILRRGYSQNAFGDEWQRLSSAGYICVNFETYMLNNKQVWDGVFKKQSGRQAMWRNFEFADFKLKWDEMNNKGYRLMDLETYMVGSKRYYAGLFQPGSGKYAMYRGLSTDDFGIKREELGKSGFKLIDIEVYYENGQQKWCGVWVEGKDGLLNRNVITSEFQKLVENRKKDGWNLIDVETYLDGKTRKWAGIWAKSTLSQEVLFSYKHDQEFSNKLNSNLDNGMVLTSIERY